MKKLLVCLVVLSMVFALSGFGEAASKGYLGISMPTKSSERWIKDGGTMKEILEKKDTKLIYSTRKMIFQLRKHRLKI